MRVLSKSRLRHHLINLGVISIGYAFCFGFLAEFRPNIWPNGKYIVDTSIPALVQRLRVQLELTQEQFAHKVGGCL